MSINGPPDCHLCERPIRKGSGVLLGKKLFHPGCAVEVAKEKKHANNTDDACGGKEGSEGGTVSCADPRSN